MGQQHRKVVKRRRRLAYVERKKSLAKQGVARKVGRSSKAVADTEEKPAKKSAVKKKVAKKTTAKAPEAEAPEVEETTASTAETGAEESAE